MNLSAKRRLPAKVKSQLRRLRAACLKSQGNTLRYCCGHVACMIAGCFGGTIVVGRVQGEPHYWNRLPCGVEVDLTSCQYGGDGFTPLASAKRIREQEPPIPTPFEFLIFANHVLSRLEASPCSA